MYGYRSPYSRAHSGGRSGHRQLFLLMVALACLTGYYAFSWRQFDRRQAETSHVMSGAPIVGHAWVVDGDSLRIAGISIRLEGIDAPEWDQSCTDSQGRSWLCGRAASRQLRDRIGGQALACRPRARDRYGRVVAACALPDGGNVNAWLVRQGLAVASGYGGLYVAEEAEARAEKRGIWAGSFTLPSEWRRLKAHHPHHRAW
jgi:endonuclease YncB( thermonuclease family)